MANSRSCKLQLSKNLTGISGLTKLQNKLLPLLICKFFNIIMCMFWLKLFFSLSHICLYLDNQFKFPPREQLTYQLLILAKEGR